MPKQNKQKARKIRSLFLYLLAIALALLVYSFLVIKVNTTGKVIYEMQDSCTLSQVSSHNNAGNCWIINKNNIYDITGLIDDVNFKESDCGKEIILSDYFIQFLEKNNKVGILS